MFRQFPSALKLYDRALDITPDNPYEMASKASIYQAQGDLQEAARSLSEISEQTPNDNTLPIKITQLRLERNYAEAVRLLQAQLAQFHYDSQFGKGSDQVALAFAQRLVGDTAGAKITAEQARTTFEQLCRDQPDNVYFATSLSQVYTVMGEKDSALKEAEHAIMLRPTVKDRLEGPAFEENLALIQTIFGENSRAISTLRQLLQTPYSSPLYGPAPVTPALLRLDPIWDPFARRSRVPKTLRRKAALNICNLLGLKEAQSHRVKYWEIIADNLPGKPVGAGAWNQRFAEKILRNGQNLNRTFANPR